MQSQATLHHGVYPWNEPSRKPKTTENPVFYGKDTPAQIALCLNCKMSRCVNCIENRKRKYVPRTARKQKMCLFRERFVELWNKGLTAQELCEELNIGRSAYYHYKKELIDSKGERTK